MLPRTSRHEASANSAISKTFIGPLYALALLCAILLGCGAPPEPEEELGALEQPITAANGHGMNGLGTRCQTPTWAGGYCWLPEEKGWVVSYFDIDPSSPEYPSEYGLWRASMRTAILGWQSELNAHGWGIAYPGDNAQWWSVSVICGEPSAADPAVRGRTIPVASWPNIVSMPYGELRKFTVAKVIIDCHDIEFDPNYSTRNTTQRSRYIQNITRHELFHAVGLGHAGGACDLMGTSAVNDCWYTGARNPTATEWSYLDAFEGDGD